MRDNEWLAYPGLEDIECPPSARRLKLRSQKHELSLDLEFCTKSLEEIRSFGRSVYSVDKYEPPPGVADLPGYPSKTERVEKLVSKLSDYVSRGIGGTEIPICFVSFAIAYPVSLKLTPKALSADLPRLNFGMSGCLMGSATVLKI